MATFNPYRQALGDPKLVSDATRQYWRGWCCKCNSEKPAKGGAFPSKKGEPCTTTMQRQGGVVRKFICAECLEKREKAA